MAGYHTRGSPATGFRFLGSSIQWSSPPLQSGCLSCRQSLKLGHPPELWKVKFKSLATNCSLSKMFIQHFLGNSSQTIRKWGHWVLYFPNPSFTSSIVLCTLLQPYGLTFLEFFINAMNFSCLRIFVLLETHSTSFWFIFAGLLHILKQVFFSSRKHFSNRLQFLIIVTHSKNSTS